MRNITINMFDIDTRPWCIRRHILFLVSNKQWEAEHIIYITFSFESSIKLAYIAITIKKDIRDIMFSGWLTSPEVIMCSIIRHKYIHRLEENSNWGIWKDI